MEGDDVQTWIMLRGINNEQYLSVEYWDVN